MKKRCKSLICTIIVIMLFITGCGNLKEPKTTISYTFKVETGDSIIVSLVSNDGYSLSSDLPFVISKDKEVLSQGTFILADYYDAYVEGLSKDEKSKVIDEGEKDNYSYLMWNYNDSEFNYVIKIKGSNTGIILGNNVSEESAKECFERLELKIKE